MRPERLTDKVCELAADILGVDPTDLGPETTSEAITSWDSMQHLNLVLALELEFDLALDPEEIEAMTSIAAIVEILSSTRNP